MAKIVIFNDGKGKWQSYEAMLVDTEVKRFLENDEFVYDLDVSSLAGFGENADEAISNLRTKLNYIVNELLKIQQAVNNSTIEITQSEVQYND